MPLPTQLQEQVDFQTEIEAVRGANQAAAQKKNIKLEALRMAKEIAMENHRSAPAGTVLSATDIVAMAADLEAFTAS